jgi:hypothetical protein
MAVISNQTETGAVHDVEGEVFDQVAEALRGIRFGEVVVVVIDGQVERIDRVHRSRPFKATKLRR